MRASTLLSMLVVSLHIALSESVFLMQIHLA